MERLREHYEKVLRTDLTKQFGYANAMAVPRLEKIVVNMGVGEASQDRKKIDGAVQDLTLITGQKPIVTLAKKSIATFSCATARSSVARSRCAGPACTNSSTGW